MAGRQFQVKKHSHDYLYRILTLYIVFIAVIASVSYQKSVSNIQPPGPNLILVKSIKSEACLKNGFNCFPSLQKESHIAKPQATMFIKKRTLGTATPESALTPICKVNVAEVMAKYDQVNLDDLAATNAAVDNLRLSAQNSGESYSDFDAQSNTLFQIYNAKISTDYTNYKSQLAGCGVDLKEPVMFQMFTP